jgi:ketosteroid isomerase-like protein
VGFVDCINRADLDGLTRLMTEDHELIVLDEPPLEGRDANARAWRGYFTAFPAYVVHPGRFEVTGDHVTLFGTTTGSHLGLPDDEEMQLGVVWTADVVDGRLARWRISA